ncbi:MAG: sugar ABC transporter ATP-binding protein [Deltaproteobacteria bacterium]|nr:sugar ABC transporter ATP-binding protein [Deltaproteobacteria bacterium]
MSLPSPLLATFDLHKAYAQPVLRGVNWAVRAGEVHALVGENGAGKSTLARVVCGMTSPNAGHMQLAGRPWSPSSRRDADAQGVRMVLQELGAIGTLTVAENIFRGRLPTKGGGRWGVIDRKRLHEEARVWMAAVGLQDVAPDALVSSLGVGQKQLVEIAGALTSDVKLLILDEPTAALTGPETQKLFEQIRRLCAGGTAVVYISHRLEELQEIATRLTVLRDGVMVGTHNTADLSIDKIIKLMAGRALSADEFATAQHGEDVGIEVRNLRVNGVVRDVSFSAHKGEILGFAGLMGAGRTETMRALFGADVRDAGEVFIDGEPVTIRHPRDAVRAGVALLTEDRKEQGLLLPLGITTNVSVVNLPALAKHGVIDESNEASVAERFRQTLAVKAHNLSQPVGELSGGNQQKVLIARWLFRDCRVLIFDEPTRGIDVGARFEIYKLMRDLAHAGKTILVVSSDLTELMQICHRIAVLSRGELVQTFRRDTWTQASIMAAAFSGYLGKAATDQAEA